jgi:hypothetical protein
MMHDGSAQAMGICGGLRKDSDIRSAHERRIWRQVSCQEKSFPVLRFFR